jgi:hypothetical protein
MEQEPTLKISAGGTKSWRIKGKVHRVDGPAVEWPDGTKEWWLNEKRHRIDGPAIDRTTGDKSWWLNDEYYSFEDWKIKVREYYDTQEDYLLMLLKL